MPWAAGGASQRVGSNQTNVSGRRGDGADSPSGQRGTHSWRPAGARRQWFELYPTLPKPLLTIVACGA